jgi:hypothetical protein
MSSAGQPWDARASFAVVILGSCVGTGLLTTLGYPGAPAFGLALLTSLGIALLAGWAARRWVSDLPMAPLAFGAALVLLGAGLAIGLVPRRLDYPALRARLRDQMMMASVGKKPDPLQVDGSHFGSYEPAARYLMSHAEPLTQAAQAFRGGSGMLDHLLSPKNLGTPEGRAAVRLELAKVDAALQELRAQADPVIGPGLPAGLRACGTSEPVIQAFTEEWKATPHFSAVGDFCANQAELLTLARSILENLDAANVKVGPDGRLMFTDLTRFDRQERLSARFSERAREAQRLNAATRIYISN